MEQVAASPSQEKMDLTGPTPKAAAHGVVATELEDLSKTGTMMRKMAQQNITTREADTSSLHQLVMKTSTSTENRPLPLLPTISTTFILNLSQELNKPGFTTLIPMNIRSSTITTMVQSPGSRTSLTQLMNLMAITGFGMNQTISGATGSEKLTNGLALTMILNAKMMINAQLLASKLMKKTPSAITLTSINGTTLTTYGDLLIPKPLMTMNNSTTSQLGLGEMPATNGIFGEIFMTTSLCPLSLVAVHSTTSTIGLQDPELKLQKLEALEIKILYTLAIDRLNSSHNYCYFN
jgi:hypothetical protein